MVEFSIIVAMDANRGIGKNGKLPWHLPGELKHFKEITSKTNSGAKQNVVIMGRKTWESLPEKFRPLPGRINIVISRNKRLRIQPQVIIEDSFDKALKTAQKNITQNQVENIFVIGGQQIFEIASAHPQCSRLYVTHIEQRFDCDVFFPEFTQTFRRELVSSPYLENDIHYYFAQYAHQAKSSI